MFRQLPPAAPVLSGQDMAAGLRTSLHHNGSVQAFATAMAHYFGVKTAFLAASGRTALHLLLAGLARRTPERREVVLPAYTCPSLVKVIQQAELETRLCDVSPQTFDFEREQLRKLVSERTLAVIPVHPFGIPQEIRDVLALAETWGAVVIEDAAQAMGARLHGRMAGAWGHFGLTSLGPGKALSTGGGGALLVDDKESAALAAGMWNELPSRSRTKSVQALFQASMLATAFRPAAWWWITRLGIDGLGDRESSWGFRVEAYSAAQAGVGQSLLGRLDAINAARSQRAARLIEALEGTPGLRFPQVVDGAEPIYVRLPLLVTGEERRNRLFDELRAAGIGVGKMYRQPLSVIFPDLDRDGEPYPGARAIAAQLLTLPTHHYVTDADIVHIATTARQLDR